MSDVDDVDKLIEQYQLATVEFVKGNPEPYKAVFSHREDVTLANPFFPPVRGWGGVAQKTLELTAARLRDGELVGSEIISKYVTPALAYAVSLVRERAKVGGSEDISQIALRTTMILRPEDGVWKVMHLHGDPITTPQSAESVIQE
jgi:ketosteroid isomerase-like protein